MLSVLGSHIHFKLFFFKSIVSKFKESMQLTSNNHGINICVMLYGLFSSIHISVEYFVID